jgi:hypothetical protein
MCIGGSKPQPAPPPAAPPPPPAPLAPLQLAKVNPQNGLTGQTGRASLRIDRTTGFDGSSQGSGLNIPL